MPLGPEGLNPTISGYLDDIKAAQSNIISAEEEAERLERTAQELRTEAAERHVSLFDAAGEELASETDSGLLTPIQVATAVARLSALDPTNVRIHGENHGEAMIAAFKSLVAGTPVMGLRDSRGQPRVGVVQSKPSEVTVHTHTKRQRSTDSSFQVVRMSLAPWATFTVPLLTIKDGTPQVVQAETELSTIRQAHIGHSAIQAFLNSVSFETHRDASSCHPSTTGNGLVLGMLKRAVEELQALDVEGIDTTKLDEAFDKSQVWGKAQRRAAFRH